MNTRLQQFARTVAVPQVELAHASVSAAEQLASPINTALTDERSFYAIDKAGILDVDDAIRVDTDQQGNSVYSTAVANPGRYIDPYRDTAAYAFGMARSHYIEDWNMKLPMLPVVLSQFRLSLRDGLSRPALVTSFSHDGQSITPHDIRREQIQATATSKEAIETGFHPALPQGFMQFIYPDLSAAAHELTAVRSRTDVNNAQQSELLSADNVVHEFMLATSCAVAQIAIEHDLPVLHRNYERSGKSYLSTTPVKARSGHEYHASATSPLRKIVDFVNDANVSAILDGRNPVYERDFLDLLAGQINSRTYRQLNPPMRNLRELADRGALQSVITQLDATTGQSNTTERIRARYSTPAGRAYSKEREIGQKLKDLQSDKPITMKLLSRSLELQDEELSAEVMTLLSDNDVLTNNMIKYLRDSGRLHVTAPGVIHDRNGVKTSAIWSINPAGYTHRIEATHGRSHEERKQAEHDLHIATITTNLIYNPEQHRDNVTITSLHTGYLSEEFISPRDVAQFLTKDQPHNLLDKVLRKQGISISENVTFSTSTKGKSVRGDATLIDRNGDSHTVELPVVEGRSEKHYRRLLTYELIVLCTQLG